MLLFSLQGRHMHSTPVGGKVKRPNVAVGMILSLLLHYQDPANYRATQQLTSLLLHLSGCKDQIVSNNAYILIV